MPPRVGNRASESDFKNYSPKEVLFGPEADRRRKRTDKQVLSESRSRVGKGEIGQPAGQAPTPKPTQAPEGLPPTPKERKGVPGDAMFEFEKKITG
jgi:hypothetical protein